MSTLEEGSGDETGIASLFYSNKKFFLVFHDVIVLDTWNSSKFEL